MLMFQMYGDSKLIYREYVQNARDAINDAVKEGVLSKITEGHIIINIDNNNRKITIHDNGTGVPIERVEPVLLDIADSNKDGETSAGQFGIGRLVGGYFCKKLTFKTSYKGEDVASEIVFDIDKIKAILDDSSNNSTATEVIDICTDKNIYEEETDKHYFTVTLEDIHPDYPELLNEEIISDYLKEVAPVDYNSAFKNQLIQTSVHDEYIDYQKQVGHFQISVNDEVSIKKRYGLNIEGTNDQIINLNYFSLPDDTHGLLAWGWYALTEFSRAIPASDRSSCFRLRKHNIQVGDANLLTDLFPRNETRGNKYFYGEIHIANQKIKLNSARDGLAPTPEAECLKQRIRDYFDHLVKLYHLANDMKKATEGLLKQAKNK
ncbi:MAG: ATP-binding protein [Bacteroidales bacterium]|nr:ATP-binding protein [Bacteroidales bacterium]